MSIVLYEHNQRAYESAVSLMSETGKAAVIHPTGTGKSFIGFKLAEQHPDSLICWLSPSEYIYKTQIENLKAAADGYEPDNIYFMTYAKLMMTDDYRIEKIEPDYIILDEFHRCGAAEWGKGVERLLNTYPDVPLLGITATNIRYLDGFRDVAEEIFDSNVASEMTLGEAIVRNILLPPTYITSVYSCQKDLEKYQKRTKKAKNKIVRDAAQKYLDELRRTLTKADGLDVIFDKHIKNRTGKIIAFCSNVEHMNEMIARVPEWFGKIDSAPHIYSVYSEDSSSDKAFAEFKTDDSEHLKLMFTIDMLNEGIHLEGISSVILFRPTVSPIIYKQQIGRALSAGKGQTPVIFDVVNNFENLYSIGSIEEEMREAIIQYREMGNGESIVNASFKIIDEAKDCRRLFDELEDSLSASWDMMFETAKEYYGQYGNLLVPKRYKTDAGWSLGSWIETQRRVKNGTVPGIMTRERIEKLESVGMVWQSFAEFSFERNYQYAKEYYGRHGNLDVSVDYETSDGFALGRWICNLRSSYKGNGRSSLIAEKVRLLDEIGMIWDKNGHLFEKNLALAREYYNEHGNLEVKSGTSLGMWLGNVRTKYKAGKLTDYQIEALNSAGMIWTSRYDVEWDENYSKAEEYYREYGNLDVPAAYTTDGFSLGAWVRRHRVGKKTGKAAVRLTKERKEKLDKIGMIWSVDESWNVRYELLLKYHREHGNIEIPQSYVAENNIWLGKWLHVQKRIFAGMEKGQSLTAEQIEKLNALGIDWNIDYKARLFDEYLNDLKAYRAEHGNLNIPVDYVGNSGRQLNNLMIILRKKYKDGKLDAKQAAELSKLGFVWEIKDTWDDCYTALAEHIKRTGSITIPSAYCAPNGVKLSAWLSNQKNKYKNPGKYGEITEERIKKLEALGFNMSGNDIWFTALKRAREYFDEHGNIDVPNPFRLPDGYDLGYWLYCQRKDYRAGKLSKEKVSILNLLHIDWRSIEEQKWDSNYEKLKLYKQKYNTVNMSVTYCDDGGFGLGKWLDIQRKRKDEGKLTDEQSAKLESLGVALLSQSPTKLSSMKHIYSGHRNEMPFGK